VKLDHVQGLEWILHTPIKYFGDIQLKPRQSNSFSVVNRQLENCYVDANGNIQSPKFQEIIHMILSIPHTNCVSVAICTEWIEWGVKPLFEELRKSKLLQHLTIDVATGCTSRTESARIIKSMQTGQTNVLLMSMSFALHVSAVPWQRLVFLEASHNSVRVMSKVSSSHDFGQIERCISIFNPDIPDQKQLTSMQTLLAMYAETKDIHKIACLDVWAELRRLYNAVQWMTKDQIQKAKGNVAEQS
jgi:hypothetical protein